MLPDDVFRTDLDEGTLRLYALSRLRGERLDQADEHLLVCHECQDRLSAVDNLLLLRTIRDLPVNYTHQTADGPIQVRVVGRAGLWRATLAGQMLADMREFLDLRQANEYALGAFWEMFPEHRECVEGCGPGEAD
jgi:hypothetical protein